MPSTASRPALGATQPSIQSVLATLSTGAKRPQHEAEHLPPLLPILMVGATLPPPHIRSKNAQGQIYFLANYFE